MSVWVEVKILPRPEILDVQGRAVMQMLQQNEKPVESCRYGKCIHLEVDADDISSAKQKVKEMADFVLYNPLTETYTVEVIPDPEKQPLKP